MVYLGLTIADCLFLVGFLQSAGHTKRTVRTIPIKGVTIGTVAILLGVRGSAMTVLLMRRAGLSMAQSSAMANPLSVPVALVGSLMYAVTGQLETAGIHNGFLGYIYLPAFGLLTVGSLIGVRLTLLQGLSRTNCMHIFTLRCSYFFISAWYDLAHGYERLACDTG